MNYRHAFHAGNHGDVLKHVLLLAALRLMQQKPKPLHVLDSHAGAGRYDLAGDEALRAGEWRLGIGALLADPGAEAMLPDYIAALRHFNPALGSGGQGLRWYPGSPLLVQHALRQDDRATFIELQEDAHAALRRALGRDERVAVHKRDAYEALKALLPPQPRRGLALIDPPFEEKSEFESLADMLEQVQQRWPSGTLMIWYPIKDRRETDAWTEALVPRLPAPMLRAELLVRAASNAQGLTQGLNGSGILIVNPPWQMAEAVKAPLDYLGAKLAREKSAGTRLDWLRPE